MKRNVAASILVLLILFMHSCDKTTVAPSNIINIPIGFPEMPFPDDNPMSQDAWELGKLLFRDPVFSIDSSISCASCHKQSLAFADDVAFSPGAFDRDGVRNAPSLGNIGYHPYYLREGSVPTLEMQALVPIQEHNEFANDILSISEKLKQNPTYVDLAQKAFDRLPDPYVITRSLGTFQRSLISGNSAYDQYVNQGRLGSLTAEEIRGMNLFFGKKTNCSSCHSDFNFTNYAFENNGLDTTYSDPGRMRFTGLESDESKFKVPSLRNVALTAPYMHNGQFNTLKEVIEHYNSGGKSHKNKSHLVRRLYLSDDEINDLIAFLESLTDYSFIENPIFQ